MTIRYTKEQIELIEKKFSQLSRDRDYYAEKLNSITTQLELYREFLKIHKDD